MKRTIPVLLFVAVVAPLRAQQPAPVVAQPATQPQLTTPLASLPADGTFRYFSNGPVAPFTVEPVSAERVKVGDWEAAGFDIVTTEGRTTIVSKGEASAVLGAGRLSVERVEMGFADGRGFLTLVRPSR